MTRWSIYNLAGRITVTRDLSEQLVSSYNFSVTVTDLDGITDGPKELLIYITNLKRPPYIHNLPQTVTVEEGVTAPQDLIQVRNTHTHTHTDTHTHTQTDSDCGGGGDGPTGPHTGEEQEGVTAPQELIQVRNTHTHTHTDRQ